MTTCLLQGINSILFRLDPAQGQTLRNAPSTGLQSHAAATLLTASVTCQFLLPTRTRRIATSAAVHAARSASARRPVTGLSGVAPTTIVSALIAANPSMCAPRCNFTTSPLASFCSESGSELCERGLVVARERGAGGQEKSTEDVGRMGWVYYS